MAYNNRGTVYFESENYDMALKDFKKAIEINSNYAMALCNRAAIYHLQEHYTGALVDLEQAVQIQPNNATALLIEVLQEKC